jgi:hypothetical protein
VGSNAFYNCQKLENVIMNCDVQGMGAGVFSGCYSLKSVIINGNITSYASGGIFSSCYSLKSVVINGSITNTLLVFYANRSLEIINIPDGIDTIVTNAFYECYSLKSIVIPESVTTIENTAFYGCGSLKSIIIPKNVATIGSGVFSTCYGMKFYDFTQHTSVPTLANSNAFYGIPSDCEIRVPASLYNEWKSATNWSSLASKIVAV